MVAKVFKTLAKVPCYIAICYLIANIVFFAIFYFRALGMSYVVMQTAVENNYIPNNEALMIKASLESFSSPDEDGGQDGGTAIPVAGKFAMFIDTSNTVPISELYNKEVDVADSGITVTSVNNRVQYGRTTKVGVGYVFITILPLAKDGNVLDYTKRWTSIPITITYTVPGLKYYPDL